MLMHIETNMKGQENNLTQVVSEGYFKALNIKIISSFAPEVLHNVSSNAWCYYKFLFQILAYVNNKLIISMYLFPLENIQHKMRRQQVIPLR